VTHNIPVRTLFLVQLTALCQIKYWRSRIFTYHEVYMQMLKLCFPLSKCDAGGKPVLSKHVFSIDRVICHVQLRRCEYLIYAGRIPEL
jgi:hypothetical protein